MTRSINRFAVLVTMTALFATLALAEAPAPPAWRAEGVPRTIAIGNVHGSLEPLVALLRTTGVVDADQKWSAGKAHLVLLGDLIDHGSKDREVLDLAMRLASEAAAAGGAVHVVLGEHELMNLTGDFRHVSRESFAPFADPADRIARDAAYKRYTAEHRGSKDAFDAEFPPGWFGRRAAFSQGGRYAAFLAAQAPAVLIDGTLYVHGGLVPGDGDIGVLAKQFGTDLVAFAAARDRLLAAGLVDPETRALDLMTEASGRLEARAGKLAPGEAAGLRAAIDGIAAVCTGPAFRSDGPSRYSGWSLNPENDEAAPFKSTLARVGAKRAVVAHRPTRGGVVTSRFGGALVRIDTGMYRDLFRGRPVALVVEGDNVRGIGLENTPEPPRAEPPPPTPEQLAKADAEEEQYLLEAEVIKSEDIGIGITHPHRLTLRRNGEVRRASFKALQQAYSGRVKVGKSSELDFTDDWRYEIAAYRLDRMIGLRRVPVAVQRTVDGQRGAVVAWLEQSIDEERRIKERLEPDDPDEQQAALDAMHVFDVLVYNVDNNLGNRLYTLFDWRMYIIDHTRAFRLSVGKPPALAAKPLVVAPELARGLKSLTREKLDAALKDVLTPAQIKAILERRDLILKEAKL